MLFEASLRERGSCFFRCELECQVVRKLAVRLGYVPASMDVLLCASEELQHQYALNYGCYDFLNRAYDGAGLVRGTRCDFPPDGPKWKYAALFDERPMCASLRMGADAFDEAQAFSTSVEQALGIADVDARLHAEVCDLANLIRRWQMAVASASSDVPDFFANRTWPAYLKCVQLSGYYLSVEEIVLVASMASVNITIFSQRGARLEFAAGSLEGDGPTVCVMLAADNQGRVRSHFSILMSASQVDAFATAVVAEAEAEKQRARDAARQG
jgi:hypothetical protein